MAKFEVKDLLNKFFNKKSFIKFFLFEPYDGKLSRMDLMGGKFVKIYLSNLDYLPSK